MGLPLSGVHAPSAPADCKGVRSSNAALGDLMPLGCRPNRRFAYLLVLVLALTLLAGVADARADISFRADYESGTCCDSDGWHDVQYEFDRPMTDSFSIVTNPVRQGHYAAKVVVQQGYSAFGWNEDTEAASAMTGQGEGADYYYAWSTMFDPSWVSPYGWGDIVQFYTDNFAKFGGPPPVSLDTSGTGIVVSVLAGRFDEPGTSADAWRGWYTHPGDVDTVADRLFVQPELPDPQHPLARSVERLRDARPLVRARRTDPDVAPVAGAIVDRGARRPRADASLRPADERLRRHRPTEAGPLPRELLPAADGPHAPVTPHSVCSRRTSSTRMRSSAARASTRSSRLRSTTPDSRRRAHPLAPAASSPPPASQSNAPAAPTGPDLPLVGNLSPATDSGCSGCVVSTSRGPGDVDATIAGGLDSLDTAYELADFGGSSGWGGRVWTRDVIALAPSTALGGNLSVLQQRDASGNLVWEIYIDGSNRQLSLWSPAGGLGSSAINQSTGVVMDGQSHSVEVSALPNDSVVVRVDGQDQDHAHRALGVDFRESPLPPYRHRPLRHGHFERAHLDQPQRRGGQHPRLARQPRLASRCGIDRLVGLVGRRCGKDEQVVGWRWRGRRRG